MSDIFLSYDRDDRERAAKLAAALEARGWSVWWDVEIPPGKTFDQVIEQALAETRCVVVLWSRSSVESDWVKTEASEGRDRGILVPVLIDPVKIPLAFRRIQAADLVDWFESGQDEDMRGFERAVETLVGRKGAAPVAQAPATASAHRPPPARSGRRWLIAGAVLLALLLLAVLVAPRLSGRGKKPAVVQPRPEATEGALDEGSRPGSVSRPEAETDSAAGDASRGEVRPAVVRIEIAPGRFGSHGFLAAQGYLIAMSEGLGDEERVAVTWREGQERVRALAEVVRRGPQMSLLRLVDRAPPGREPVIRNSVSLNPGDPVVRYLGPTDRTPGTVVEVGAEREVWAGVGRSRRFRALVTTNISAVGDAGAPVLDEEGRVVAVVYGGSQTETVSVPIEELRVAFPEAF